MVLNEPAALGVAGANNNKSNTRTTMKRKYQYLLTALMIVGVAAGCSTSSEQSDELTSDVKAAKEEFLKGDSSLSTILGSASGYVVFPSVAKGAVGVGAATGKGQLFVSGHSHPQGEAALTQLTIGLQMGGQAYSELLVFQDSSTLDNFQKGNFEFSAQATAVAVTAGASANAKYEKGVMVFTIAKGGLMYEASIGGQKFSYTAY
jgi:lipid-binding SYLF domain-containing protein